MSLATAPLAKQSFPPIVDAGSRVLVLGTLPSETSLRCGEYYAHPRNLFWPILFALFGAARRPESPSYPEKLALLAAHGIALWDVVASGERAASADATIRNEQPNAIDALLAAHSDIRTIAFNGSTARRLFERHVTRLPDRRYLALPSTSPAHARLGFAEKLARWAALRDALAGA